MPYLMSKIKRNDLLTLEEYERNNEDNNRDEN